MLSPEARILIPSEVAFVRRMFKEKRAVHDVCDSHESLRAALDTLKKIINTDGSLDTFESHVDILRDAMHYLSIAGEYDTMHEEIRRLTKLLAEASRDR